MDRFIANGFGTKSGYFSSFKIQYGQIYSVKYGDTTFKREDLKSNMDRFIEYRLKQAQYLNNI